MENQRLNTFHRKTFYAVSAIAHFIGFSLSEGKRHFSLKVHRYLSATYISARETCIYARELREFHPHHRRLREGFLHFLLLKFSFCQRFASIGRARKPRNFFIVEILKCFIKFSSQQHLKFMKTRLRQKSSVKSPKKVPGHKNKPKLCAITHRTTFDKSEKVQHKEK